MSSKRMGFGIGKEIGRERDEATEKREWDFGRGERCQNHVLQATCFPFFYADKRKIFTPLYLILVPLFSGTEFVPGISTTI